MSGLTIISGPAGSGKTERLVALAARRVEEGPFAATLVLVPTARHGDQFRRRVVGRCGVALNLEVTTLHFFARGVADTSTVPTVDVAAEVLRRATRERIGAGAAGRFAPIADTPGLRALLDRAVSELVGADVAPSDLHDAAARAGSADHEALAAVYGAYRELLDEHGWRDPRETPTLAAEAIDAGATVPGLVLIDSFEFLNPRELELVAALARRTEVAVALDREGSERARWTAERLDALAPDAARENLPPRPGTTRVSARTAFDNEAQLREIARAIKQTLAEDSSLRPSDFAVVFRQAAPHLTLARRVFAEYDLPFDPAAGERLASRPFGAWVLQLLRLPQHDWRLTRVGALLRSAFLDRGVWGVEGDTVDHALRVGRRLKLFSGVDAIGRLARGLAAGADDAGEGRERYAQRLRVAAGAIENAASGLEAVLGGDRRSAGAWAAALDEALFGTDGLARASVEGYESLDVETSALRADLDALRAIDEALEGPRSGSTSSPTSSRRVCSVRGRSCARPVGCCWLRCTRCTACASSTSSWAGWPRASSPRRAAVVASSTAAAARSWRRAALSSRPRPVPPRTSCGPWRPRGRAPASRSGGRGSTRGASARALVVLARSRIDAGRGAAGRGRRSRARGCGIAAGAGGGALGALA